MATAFTKQEEALILAKLKRTAWECAVTLGVRKTTVDQLSEAAGISKGAFYKFYESKELLFFEVLEGMHTEIYGAAAAALRTIYSGTPADQAAEAVLAACRAMDQTGMMTFLERDAPYLLRKVPQGHLNAHYHDDEVHIQELLEAAGLQPSGGMALAAATVRGLMLTVAHKQEIGPLYPKVLDTLVRGACRQILP